MRRSAPRTPLVAKASAFKDERGLRAFLRAIEGSADAVLLINAVSRRVADRRGRAAFGPGREVSGVIGREILETGLWNVERSARIAERDRLALKVLAVGGVLSVEDAARYFEAGAQAVFLGGAPADDPLMAIRMKRERPEW